MTLLDIITISLIGLLPGFAEAQTLKPDTIVSYSDLDLRTAAGLNTLDARLDAAGKAACPSAANSVDPTFRRAVRDCIATRTLANAARRDRILAEAQASRAPSAPQLRSADPALYCRSC